MTTSNHLSMEVGYISVLLHTNSRLLSSTVEYLSGTDPSKVLDDSGAGAYWIVPSSAPDSVPLFDHMDGIVLCKCYVIQVVLYNVKRMLCNVHVVYIDAL